MRRTLARLCCLGRSTRCTVKIATHEWVVMSQKCNSEKPRKGLVDTVR
jgi:hypothetical protein